MNHEELYTQVKSEYARIASERSRRHPSQSIASQTPEMHYEKRLEQVLSAISDGAFDTFQSGAEIVEAVEQNPGRWLRH